MSGIADLFAKRGAQGKIGALLRLLEQDPGSLVTFLSGCGGHGGPQAGLAAELRHAGIDVQKGCALLEKLNALNAHRYPINRIAYQFAKSLF
ncbi:hypothetical protein [Luteimonas sp. 100069]|uniref:hypothetical protein n=1 Tax=Luteimonas sp. 100069 TaxID=2006109 RepID=UPI000F4EA660|nr:hypothetical protein [Luteimonas sp. 100069]